MLFEHDRTKTTSKAMHPNWWAARAKTREPGKPDENLLRFVRRWLAPVVRLMHRPKLDGLDNLPERGPFMLVANHSGGMGASEIASFAILYLEKMGVDRPLAGMAHPFGFSIWPISSIIRGLGSIPSTYEAVRETLAKGVPVLLFPGGDYESTRPIWQAKKVMFAGRKGFLKLARDARVPIIPMGIRGSHYSAPILWRSERLLAWLLILPRVLGVKRYPLTLLGMAGAVAIGCLSSTLSWPVTALLIWLWLASPFPFVPIIPATVRIRIGRPIPPEDLFAGGADLSEPYKRVEAAVQDIVAG